MMEDRLMAMLTPLPRCLGRLAVHAAVFAILVGMGIGLSWMGTGLGQLLGDEEIVIATRVMSAVLLLASSAVYLVGVATVVIRYGQSVSATSSR